MDLISHGWRYDTMLHSGVLAVGSDPLAKVAPTVGVDDILTLARALCRVPFAAVFRSEENGSHQLSSQVGDIDPNLFLSLIGTVESEGVLVMEDCAREPIESAARNLTEYDVRFVALAGTGASGASSPASIVLVVADRTPRVLTAEQEDALAALGRQLGASPVTPLEPQVVDSLTDNVTELTARLHASEQLFRTFMDAGPFLSFIKDSVGRLLFYNRAYAQHFGISEHAWLGRTDNELWSQNQSSAHRISDIEAMRGGRTVVTEVKLIAKDQATSFWRTYRFPCRDSQGNLLLAGLALEITEEHRWKAEIQRSQQDLQEANHQLRRLSVTDPLTGIRNRRAFEERLLLEFSMSRRRRRDLAILLLDIDDFKLINDQWGHPAGDQVLKRVAAILRTTVRLPDMVARYGGEEFIILLPESNAIAAQGLARRLLNRLAQEQWEHQPVTLSIGVAGLNNSLLNGYQLVTMADEALYAAKRAGKNRVVTYGPGEVS